MNRPRISKLVVPVAMAGALLASQLVAPAWAAETVYQVKARSDIKFQPLNPARGDASPKAGVLWGDMKKNVPTGALIVFADGFSSPPHIHNITYRAVVISGAVHNDDPGAENMWMGPGSFWTQPAGESHITAAAKGGAATAFLEILEGPYLVQPSDEAFDNGERPVNIEARNVIWLDSSDVTWVDRTDVTGAVDGPRMAFLWGELQDGKLNGSFLKLPAGFSGNLRSGGPELRAVVIDGQLTHQAKSENTVDRLTPGSYFGSDGGGEHQVSCGRNSECTLYVRTMGKYALSAR